MSHRKTFANIIETTFNTPLFEGLATGESRRHRR